MFEIDGIFKLKKTCHRTISRKEDLNKNASTVDVLYLVLCI